MRKQTRVMWALLMLPAGWGWAAEAPPAVVPAAPAVPAAAAAPAGPAPAAPVALSAVSSVDSEDEKPGAPFRLGVSLDHDVGQGTFVNAAYFAYVGGALQVSPSYGFTFKEVKLRASANASLSWEYTLPDNQTGRRVNYSDIRLGLSAPRIFTEPVTGISLSPSFSASVPISFTSRQATTITSLSATAALSRSFGKFDLGYSLGVGRGFHLSPIIAVTNANARDSLGNLLYVCRTDETVCGVAGTNTAWSISNGLRAGYRATDKLSAQVGLSLSNSFKYSIVEEVDEYTPKALDSNGNPVARVGMGRADRMVGSLGVSYQINDMFSASLGMGTAGAPFTRDNKNLRFPWFDFVSGADNLTAYSLTVSASL